MEFHLFCRVIVLGVIAGFLIWATKSSITLDVKRPIKFQLTIGKKNDAQ